MQASNSKFSHYFKDLFSIGGKDNPDNLNYVRCYKLEKCMQVIWPPLKLYNWKTKMFSKIVEVSKYNYTLYYNVEIINTDVKYSTSKGLKEVWKLQQVSYCDVWAA